MPKARIAKATQPQSVPSGSSLLATAAPAAAAAAGLTPDVFVVPVAVVAAAVLPVAEVELVDEVGAVTVTVTPADAVAGTVVETVTVGAGVVTVSVLGGRSTVVVTVSVRGGPGTVVVTVDGGGTTIGFAGLGVVLVGVVSVLVVACVDVGTVSVVDSPLGADPVEVVGAVPVSVEVLADGFVVVIAVRLVPIASPEPPPPHAERVSAIAAIADKARGRFTPPA